MGRCCGCFFFVLCCLLLVACCQKGVEVKHHYSMYQRWAGHNPSEGVWYSVWSVPERQ